MTRTITKPARELVPGDVLPAAPGRYPRRVVYHVHRAGVSVALHTMPTAPAVPASPPPEMYAADVAVAVEAPALTPAQEHAEELFALAVRLADMRDTPERLDFRALAVDVAAPLVDKIRPPNPPTLQEALEALENLRPMLDIQAEKPGDRRAGPALAVLERARAAGVFK
jgi:hypothetical protein